MSPTEWVCLLAVGGLVCISLSLVGLVRYLVQRGNASSVPNGPPVNRSAPAPQRYDRNGALRQFAKDLKAAQHAEATVTIPGRVTHRLVPAALAAEMAHRAKAPESKPSE